MPSRALPRFLLAAIGLLLLLSGCGASSPAAPAATATPAQAAAAPSPTAPPATPTVAPATATATTAPPTRAPTPTATAAPAPSPTTAATATATAAATAAATPAAAATAKPAAAGEVRVQMINLAFQPATITVPVGTTVVWVNAEAIPHTVAHKDLTTFSSDILNKGDEFRFTFTRPGEYPYLCTIHPEMIGTVTVR